MSPLVSELTVMGEVVAVPVCVVPPLLEVQVAVYPVMALPPLLALAVKATEAELDPRVTTALVGAVGAVGTAPATKLDEAAEAALFPTALVASTVQV